MGAGTLMTLYEKTLVRSGMQVRREESDRLDGRLAPVLCERPIAVRGLPLESRTRGQLESADVVKVRDMLTSEIETARAREWVVSVQRNRSSSVKTGGLTALEPEGDVTLSSALPLHRLLNA